MDGIERMIGRANALWRLCPWSRQGLQTTCQAPFAQKTSIVGLLFTVNRLPTMGHRISVGSRPFVREASFTYFTTQTTTP